MTTVRMEGGKKFTKEQAMSLNELAVFQGDPLSPTMHWEHNTGNICVPPLLPLSCRSPLCLSVSFCVHTSTHTRAHEGTGMWLCRVCIGQQMTTGPAIQGLSAFSLRQGLSLARNFAMWARPVSPSVQGILLCLWPISLSLG